MEFVTYEQDGFVGVITINRPKALNALNSTVLEELDATFKAVDLNTTRCLVLTGAGEKSFVAGADIGEMSTLTKAEGEAFGKKGNDVFRMIETFPIPVIAAVNGFALGGGCEISMSCDIRICSENAVFGQPEVGLCIEDQGIGIRQEDIPRVFEQGYTGFNGHTDKHSTGIGLYLCKQVLTKLGHTIRITSEPGKGTQVWIGFSLQKIDIRD